MLMTVSDRHEPGTRAGFFFGSGSVAANIPSKPFCEILFLYGQCRCSRR
jgi:hypothetical protein